MSNWRQREDRKSVRIGVRVRTDDGWVDATVRNVSSRGLMLHSLQPLRRNQFVEIARGRSRVVGRVVWSNDAVCGLHAQDRVDIDGLLAKPEAGGATPGKTFASERRANPRAARARHSATIELQADSARLMGRAFEKVALLAAIACSGVIAAGSAYEAMATPLEKVQVALADQSAPG